MSTSAADRVFITGSNMIQSNDGGKTWAGLNQGGGRAGYPFITTFGDFRSFWIDPEDSDHMIATSDGGVSDSYDGGRTSDHFANLKLGEFYAIGVDMEQPYRIYGGLQDHKIWRGPSNGWSGRVNIDDWVSIGIGDGMYNEPDPTGRWLYNTQEFGTLGRVDMEARTRTIIDPTKPNSPHPFANDPADAAGRVSEHLQPSDLQPGRSERAEHGVRTIDRRTDHGPPHRTTRQSGVLIQSSSFPQNGSCYAGLPPHWGKAGFYVGWAAIDGIRAHNGRNITYP